jgi:hypothetical protein
MPFPGARVAMIEFIADDVAAFRHDATTLRRWLGAL